MQRIVIDTNIFVSSIIQKGYSYHIINALFLEDKFTLCISDELIKEYYDVLTREKFSKFHDFFLRAEKLLSDIEAKAKKYYPSTKILLISDVDDNKFLELADECLADFIITGNSTDFTFPIFKQTKIVTPKEY